MRPDAAFLIAIGLAFCGLVAIVAGLIGQASVRLPRCRRCRADAREHAWEPSPRCGCGADLTHPRAIRFVGRDRSPSAVIAGALMCGAAVLLSWWHLDRRERRLTWRELLPDSWEAANLRNGEEPNAALHSLLRRVGADQIDARDRALAIDAIRETPGGRGDLRARALAKLASGSTMMEEPGRSAAERAMESIAASLPAVRDPARGATPTAETPAPSSQRTLSATIIGSVDPRTGGRSHTPLEIDINAPSGWSRYLIVEAVLVDGVRIPGTQGIAYRDPSAIHRWLPLPSRGAAGGSDEGYAAIVAASTATTPTIELEVEDILVPLPISFAPVVVGLLEASWRGERAREVRGSSLPPALLHRSRRGVMDATVSEAARSAGREAPIR